MRRLLSLVGIGAASVVLLGVGGGVAKAAPTGSYVLTAASTAGTYAPTFTGNGLLGVRVPPSGQGYAPGTVPAQSELAGFYAQPPGDVQQRANIPTWSTLTFSDGGEQFSASSAGTTGWRQSIDLHTGWSPRPRAGPHPTATPPTAHLPGADRPGPTATSRSSRCS